MRDIFDIDNNEGIHPFCKANVYLSGNLYSREGYERTIKEFCMNEMHELTRDTHIIVVGKNPPSEDDRKRRKLIWDGYTIRTIAINKFEQPWSWNEKELSYWLNWRDSLPKGKNLNITYDALFNSTYSPIVHLSQEEDPDLLFGKRVFEFRLNKDDKLRQCIEKIGAILTEDYNPKLTEYCLLEKGTIDKLKSGEKDSTINTIENSYNSSDCEEFTCQFILASDVAKMLEC